MRAMSADMPSPLDDDWFATWLQHETHHRHHVVSEEHWDALKRRTRADLERSGILPDHDELAHGDGSGN